MSITEDGRMRRRTGVAFKPSGTGIEDCKNILSDLKVFWEMRINHSTPHNFRHRIRLSGLVEALNAMYKILEDLERDGYKVGENND